MTDLDDIKARPTRELHLPGCFLLTHPHQNICDCPTVVSNLRRDRAVLIAMVEQRDQQNESLHQTLAFYKQRRGELVIERDTARDRIADLEEYNRQTEGRYIQAKQRITDLEAATTPDVLEAARRVCNERDQLRAALERWYDWHDIAPDVPQALVDETRELLNQV